MNYYEIEQKSTLASSLLDIAVKPGEWQDYYNFKARPITPDKLIVDPFLEWLATKYDFVGGILRMHPYTCYDWHTDTRRGVGINMLLTPFNRSSCVFAPVKEGQVFTIEELPYKQNTYYAFNTQIPHTVYNYSATRYLFSIDFVKDKDELTFNELVKTIKDEYEKDRTE